MSDVRVTSKRGNIKIVIISGLRHAYASAVKQIITAGSAWFRRDNARAKYSEKQISGFFAVHYRLCYCLLFSLGIGRESKVSQKKVAVNRFKSSGGKSTYGMSGVDC